MAWTTISESAADKLMRMLGATPHGPPRTLGPEALPHLEELAVTSEDEEITAAVENLSEMIRKHGFVVVSFAYIGNA